MKNLYIVRHAKSSWSDFSLADFDRPLNDRGKRDAPAMAAILKNAGVKPDLIVTSPAKRALTTARIFREVLEVGEDCFMLNPNIYEAGIIDIEQIISHLPDTAQTVLLFGHNNTLTDVVNRFNDGHLPNLPTCGIARIMGDVPDWKSFVHDQAKVDRMWFPKEMD